MKMNNASFLSFLTLFLSAQQSYTIHPPVPVKKSADERIIHNKAFDDSFLDLTPECSNLLKVISDISAWDEDADSPLWQLYNYMVDGHVIAWKDAVLETLAYAENVVQKKSNQIEQNQLDSINNDLDVLAHKIHNGDLAIRNCCCPGEPHDPIKVRQKLYVLKKAKFFDCVTFKKCVTFEDCIEDLCVDNLTINNCMSDLCVNTLSVVDESVSGVLSVNEAVIGNLDVACDVVVGCNLIMNDSVSPLIGNIIKNGQLFMTTYPAGSRNTFMGQNSGNFTNTGIDNTGFGFQALMNDTTGFFNVAIGSLALTANTTGFRNVAVGKNVLASNTTGILNTGVGDFALATNINGTENVAVGNSALLDNVDGERNTAVGAFAMQNNTTGSFNVGIGNAALINNITGRNNVAIGDNAHASGNENVMVGANAGDSGSRNIGIGFQALISNSADRNVAVGYNSMSATIVNGDNTAIGHEALLNVKGSFNIGVGSGAGQNSTLATSNNNIYIANAGTNESDTIRVGTLGTQTRYFAAGIRGVVTGIADAIPVLIDSAGQLGTVSSSATVKHNIQDMDDVSSAIYGLRPVTFVYNGDETETIQYGLIAEEVDQIFPDIVVNNRAGKPETVQYHVLPVLLLNELQKQNATIQALAHRVDRLEKAAA